MSAPDLDLRTVAMLRRIALELGALTLEVGALLAEHDTTAPCPRCGRRNTKGGACKSARACAARARSEAAVKANRTRRERRAAVVVEAGGVQ